MQHCTLCDCSFLTFPVVDAQADSLPSQLKTCTHRCIYLRAHRQPQDILRLCSGDSGSRRQHRSSRVWSADVDTRSLSRCDPSLLTGQQLSTLVKVSGLPEFSVQHFCLLFGLGDRPGIEGLAGQRFCRPVFGPLVCHSLWHSLLVLQVRSQVHDKVFPWTASRPFSCRLQCSGCLSRN